jgi:hypothetical protein
LEHGSPFTWSDRESLDELEQPERMRAIEREHELRRARTKAKVRRNPLRPVSDADVDLENAFSTSSACLVCHK